MPKYIWLTHVLPGVVALGEQVSTVAAPGRRPLLVSLDALSFVFPAPDGGAIIGTDGGSYQVVESDTDIAAWLNALNDRPTV